MKNNWFTIENVDQVDTPALAVYYDRLKGNINRVTQMIDDVARLRPHVKTHKSSKVTQLLLEAGIQKFKCATIPEAEMLAQCNAPDVLLAYQPVGPKQARFLKLIKSYPNTQFSCLIDLYDIAENLSIQAQNTDTIVRVYIDINVGMGRTGITPDRKAVNLYTQVYDLPSMQVEGLHIYDGHIRNPDLEERRRECNASFQPIESMTNNLANKQIYPAIIAGGSPTFPIHAQRKNVECSPGTFVFWDKGYKASCPEQKFLPAALILSRIISLPEDGVVCLDLGYKSIASENPLTQRIHFLNKPKLKFISQHEEHLVLYAGKDHSLKVGDLLYGIPIHICPTVALYDRAQVIIKNQMKEEWQITARDRKITF